jgi:hypothetical protein
MNAGVVLRGADHDFSQRDFSAFGCHQQIEDVLALGLKVGRQFFAAPRLQVLVVGHGFEALSSPDGDRAQIEKAHRGWVGLYFECVIQILSVGSFRHTPSPQSHDITTDRASGR